MAELEAGGHEYSVEQVPSHRSPDYHLEVTFYTPDDTMYSMERFLSGVRSRRDVTMDRIEKEVETVVEKIEAKGKEIDEIHGVSVEERAEIRQTPFDEKEFRTD